MNDWQPYRPPWYPNRDSHHNPFSTDPATMQQGHETYYTSWTKTLAPGELERLVKAHHEISQTRL